MIVVTQALCVTRVVTQALIVTILMTQVPNIT